MNTQDLIEAEYELYKILKGNDSSFSKGKYTDKNTLLEKYHIPEEAIIEAHNEGWILDIYASCFKGIPPLPMTLSERAPRFGKIIIPSGYTLIDLPNVPKTVLYGKISMASGKRDLVGEHSKVLLKNRQRKDWSLIHSNKDELREKARLQENYPPRERIQNASAVIKGADLNGSLESKYIEQLKALEEGAPVANKILRGIANGRWMMTNAGSDALSDGDFKKLFAIYSGPDDLDLQFGKTDVISGKLDDITRCKELLKGYKIEEKDINAILSVPLGKLPTAWIEIK